MSVFERALMLFGCPTGLSQATFHGLVSLAPRHQNQIKHKFVMSLDRIPFIFERRTGYLCCWIAIATVKLRQVDQEKYYDILKHGFEKA